MMLDRIPRFQQHLCPNKNHCHKQEVMNQRQEDLKLVVSLGSIGEPGLHHENENRQGLGRLFSWYGKVLTLQIPASM